MTYSTKNIKNVNSVLLIKWEEKSENPWLSLGLIKGILLFLPGVVWYSKAHSCRPPPTQVHIYIIHYIHIAHLCFLCDVFSRPFKHDLYPPKVGIDPCWVWSRSEGGSHDHSGRGGDQKGSLSSKMAGISHWKLHFTNFLNRELNFHEKSLSASTKANACQSQITR